MNTHAKKEQVAARSAGKSLFVLADDLAAVMDDEGAEQNEPQSWLDKLDAPVGDDLLQTMRSIFTITYRQDYEKDAEEQMLAEIKQQATMALRPFEAALKRLRLKPVGTDRDHKDHSVKVFKYVIVAAKDVRYKLEIEGTGKKALFTDLVETANADELLAAARRILSMTFAEVFTRQDRLRRLWEIRQLAATSLIPLNGLLEEIEIEPIAMPKRPYIDYEGDDEEQVENSGEPSSA